MIRIPDRGDAVFVQKRIFSELVSFLLVFMISSVDFDTEIEFCTVEVEDIIAYRFLSESSVSGFIVF